MDVNRYYLPPKAKKDSAEQIERKHNAATSRFNFNNAPVRLPTPQAFFQRQRQFKEADKKAMLRFAKKKVVKHNLKMRRKELKEKQQLQIDELKSRINGVSLPAPQPKRKSLVEAPKNTEDRENHDGVELNELQTALNKDNEYDINKNVLRNFFELKDPSRIAEIDDLLAANKGREADLFDEITKEYKVVRETGRSKARAVLESGAVRRSSFKQIAIKSSFVEGNIEEAADEVRPSVKTDIKAQKTMKKIPSLATLVGQGSVVSIDSIMSVDTEVEGVKDFQKALDKEIKSKKYQGQYVTSIKERGGQWWVNKDPPKVHPSQRRRDTLLDDLRNGDVPLSI